MSQMDTIAAISTPTGRGGIGILRISGPLAITIAHVILGKIPKQNQAEYLPFRDKVGVTLDKGIALFFKSPHSFTGEDILELQGHGGPVVLDLLLQCVTSFSGVRIARPGEFSERAFINNKLDLVQAEAISDLINASSVQAAHSAVNSLQGVFSVQIYKIIDMLTNLRIYIEAAIDFPEEEINSLSESKIQTSLNSIINTLNALRSEARYGNLFREGIKVVIAGKPNSGKSSLLNKLAGYDIAIVTAIAGTTRDVLRGQIHINGIPVHIIDTAGLRLTSDEVERIGIERTWHEIKKADHVLLMVDSTDTHLSDPYVLWPSLVTHLSPGIPVTVIRNKIDLSGEKVSIRNISTYSIITLSAHSGNGVDLLCNHLKSSITGINNTESVFLARRRHLEALEVATTHLSQGKEHLESVCYAYDFLAEELRLAQQALNEITGEFSSDDLLDKIFSKFCIGK